MNTPENRISQETGLKHNARKLIASLGVIAAFAGSPETAQADTERSPDSPSLEMKSVKYAKPEKLPGYDIRISQEAREQLSESTLKIVKRYPAYVDTPAGEWFDSCTAVKVRVGDETFISSAAHCFSDELNLIKSGVLSKYAFPGHRALNFSQASPLEYGIMDPLQKTKPRTAIALAKGPVLNTRMSDWALLKAEPLKTDIAQRTESSIPAVEFIEDKTKLVPGQEVGLYGVPGANNNRPVAGRGRYLGRIWQGPRDLGKEGKPIIPAGRWLRIVGIKPSQPYSDSCNFGASGSSFVAEIDGQAYASGPLSVRINEKYDPYLLNGHQKKSLKTAIVGAREQRSIIEQELKIDTSSFTTLCGYTDETESGAKDMQNGFESFYKDPSPQKGGYDPDSPKK